MDLPGRLAARYAAITAHLPLEQRRRSRTVLIWNGLALAVGGAVVVGVFNVLLGLLSFGLAALTEPALWFLGLLGVGTSACGWLLHRVGRALPEG